MCHAWYAALVGRSERAVCEELFRELHMKIENVDTNLMTKKHWLREASIL
jgi:hypothetical protein